MRTIDRLNRLFHPRRHLAMSFVCFQIEAPMPRDFFKTPVLRSAAIAGQRLAHHDVQQKVDECRGEQNGKCPKHLVIGPGDTAADKAQHDECDPQSLWEVLACEKLPAWTYKAAVDSSALNGIGR